MSYHQFQMFEKIGTEESQIETSIELSDTVNLFIKQNTYFLSNSPNDLILSCTNISLALSGVVGRERMGTAFPHKKLSGNGVPTREILRFCCYCY